MIEKNKIRHLSNNLERMYSKRMTNTKINYPLGIEIVGSAVIENNKGEILLVRSPKWGTKWTMPGGHVEPGETIAEGLLREGVEETGLKLEPIEIFTWGELINPPSFHRKAHFIYFDLHCKALSNEITLDELELSEFQWITPKDAMNLELGEGYSEVITQFIKYKGNN